MSQNPFEAPRAELGAEAPWTPGSFEVGRALADAWRSVIGDLGVVIIGSVIFLSLAMASLASVLGLFLFLPVLIYGGVKMLLNLRDGIAGYTDLGDGFPRYWSVLGEMLSMMMLQALLYLPWVFLATAGAMQPNRTIAAAGQLAGPVVTLALMPRFVFAPFFLVEKRLGPMESMRASWIATEHQKLSAILLVIASLLVAGLGAACGVTAFISFPIASVMFASAFRQMNPAPSRAGVR